MNGSLDQSIFDKITEMSDRLEAIGKVAITAAARAEENGKDIRCLSVNMTKYEPMLKEMREEQRAHTKLRQAIVEKSVVGVVWGAIVVVGIALWQLAKSVLASGSGGING